MINYQWVVLILPQEKVVPAGVAGTDLCRTDGFAGVGGETANPGECVSHGAAIVCGVGGDAAGVGGSVGCEAGDGELGREPVGEGGEEEMMGCVAANDWAHPPP